MVYRIKIESTNEDLFNVLESIGDFIILSPLDYIVNTKFTKTIVKNKLKKSNIIISDSTILSIEDAPNYSDVVKSWILLCEAKTKIDKIDISNVEKSALHQLNDFLSTLEEELKK